MQNNQLIFVYGALRRGFWNHFFLGNAHALGEARTRESFSMYATTIPFVSPAPATCRITGEVYTVNAATLEEIDRLEGAPDWYYRQLTQVILDDDRIVSAWIYFSHEAMGELVPGGDYVAWTNGPQAPHNHQESPSETLEPVA